jgi:hypothetical protein
MPRRRQTGSGGVVARGAVDAAQPVEMRVDVGDGFAQDLQALDLVLRTGVVLALKGEPKAHQSFVLIGLFLVRHRRHPPGEGAACGSMAILREPEVRLGRKG